MIRLRQDHLQRQLLITAAGLVALAFCSACSLSPNPDLPFMSDDDAEGGDMIGAPSESDGMGGAGGAGSCLEAALAGAGGQLHEEDCVRFVK